MTDGFSSGGYARLLSAFAERGYAAVGFAAADPAARHLVLRHDVDMWPDAALALARAEAGAGMAATYFFLVGSVFYNLMAPETRAVLDELARLGHAVGLHFDAAVHPPDSLDAAADAEIAVLEAASGQAVEVVSFHRPADGLLGREQPVAGRIHTYQPRFFRDMDYCSDSRGGWHHGHPLERDSVAAGRAIQLLTHPIWWIDGGGTPQDKLDRFLAARGKVLDRELARHCAVHTAKDRE